MVAYGAVTTVQLGHACIWGHELVFENTSRLYLYTVTLINHDLSEPPQYTLSNGL